MHTEEIFLSCRPRHKIWCSSMEPLEALNLVEKALNEKGYTTRRTVEEGEPVLEVVHGWRKAKIRFHQSGGKLVELRLKYEDTPGLTVLKCERYDKYISCIEDLLSRF